MAKEKKKITPAPKKAKKAEKSERQMKYQWVFMNGKQVKIKRPEMVERMSAAGFILEMPIQREK